MKQLNVYGPDGDDRVFVVQLIYGKGINAQSMNIVLSPEQFKELCNYEAMREKLGSDGLSIHLEEGEEIWSLPDP